MRLFLLLLFLTGLECYLIIITNDRDNIITGVDADTGITQFTKAFPSYGSGTPLLIATAYSPNSSVIWFIDAGNTVGIRYVFWDLSSDTFGTGAYLDPALSSLGDVPGFWIDYTGVAYNVVLFGLSTLNEYKIADFATDGATSTAVLLWSKGTKLYNSVTYNYGDGNQYGNLISDSHIHQLNSTGDAIALETNSTISTLGFFTYNRTGDILIFLKNSGLIITQDFLSQGTSSTVNATVPNVSGITFWDGPIGGTYTSGLITTAPSLSTGAVTTSPVTTSPVPYPTGNVILGTFGFADIAIEPIDNLPGRSVTTTELFINAIFYNRLFDHDKVYFVGGDQKLKSYDLITAITASVSTDTVPPTAYFFALDNTGNLYALTSTTSPASYSLFVSPTLNTLNFNLLWTVNQPEFYTSMQFTPDTNELYMGVNNGSIYHVDVNNGTSYGVISGWPIFDPSIAVALMDGFTFGVDQTIIYFGGLNTTSGYNFLITVDRTYNTYELTKISPSGPWVSLVTPNFYNGSIFGGYTTGITTAGITSGQITTSQLTSGLITTSPLTTSPLTTSPVSTGELSTAAATTGISLTTNHLTTSKITSGLITTGRGVTTHSVTTGILFGKFFNQTYFRIYHNIWGKFWWSKGDTFKLLFGFIYFYWIGSHCINWYFDWNIY